jgi:hypothetical protein
MTYFTIAVFVFFEAGVDMYIETFLEDTATSISLIMEAAGAREIDTCIPDATDNFVEGTFGAAA